MRSDTALRFWKLLVVAGLLVLSIEIHGCWAEVNDMQAESLCRDFLMEEMVGEQGALLTNTNVKRRLFGRVMDRSKLSDSGVLSESVGLLMQYAVRSGDRDLMERQFSFLQSRMMAPTGLVYWKLSANMELTANANALVDDLRIAHALLLGFELWDDDRYLHQAIKMGQSLKKIAPDGDVRDFLNWRDSGEPVLADQISMTYLDLPAMRKLGQYDKDWLGLLKKSKAILVGGQTASGLFMQFYDYPSRKYVGHIGNMIHMSLAALYLAEEDSSNRKFLGFLQKQMEEEGRIYAQYDALTGEPTGYFESTSVYAICAILAHMQGDRKLAGTLFTRMKWFQNLNPRSDLFGAFSDDEVYSFDNLLALMAMRVFNNQTSN